SESVVAVAYDKATYESHPISVDIPAIRDCTCLPRCARRTARFSPIGSDDCGCCPRAVQRHELSARRAIARWACHNGHWRAVTTSHLLYGCGERRVVQD